MKITVSKNQPPLPASEWNHWQKEVGNPFHTTYFIEALSKLGWQGFFAAEVSNENKLISAASAVLLTKAGFSWANFFAEPVSLSGESTEVLAALASELKKHKAHFIQTSGSVGRWSQDQVRAARQVSRFMSKVPFGTYEVNLNQELDVIYKKFHPKHRKKVRLAEGAGATVKEFGSDFKEEDLSELYRLVDLTFARGKAKSPPANYFVEISRAWLKSDFARMYLVYHQERIVAGVVIPFCKNRGYSWIGGSLDISEYPFGSNDLLQWKIIQSLKALGVQVFDFGGARPNVKPGSKIDGIQKFKERFGGVFVPTDQWQADLSWKGPFLRIARKLLQ